MITPPQPLPPHLALLMLKRQLTGIIPGDGAKIGRYTVLRTNNRHTYRYTINGREMAFDRTLAVVAGRARLPQKPSLPLEDLPLFAALAVSDAA